MPCLDRRRFIAGVAVCLAIVTTAGAAADTDPRARLDAALAADVAANPGIPGEAVAVRARGLDLTAATGVADRKTGAPLTPETPFRIASVTKTFVAVAVLRLVEQHRVRLDAPIARFLAPRTRALLRAGGYRPRRITVHQLLNHTGGLFDYATTRAYDDRNVADPGHRWTRAEQLGFAMDHGKPVAEPGERYHYSDTGYVLLGEILERVTHRSLPDAVRRLVGFRRLGLHDTYWEDLEPPPPGARPRAHQYYGDDFDNGVLDASHDLYGGGGLVSTVSDLTRFYRSLFHGRILRDRTLRAMTRVSRPGRQAGAALGIFRTEVDGETCFGHPGFWGTETVHCPAVDLTYTRATNQADDSDFVSGPLERVLADLARRRPAG